jgi:hypothetical protein
MNIVTRLITMFVVALLVTLLAASPAAAYTPTGWVEHPYPSAGLWYCDYYGSDYYCQDERGNWFPAAPSWYDASYAEMMSIYGQGVL